MASPDGPSLQGCFVKLGRANKHRQELEAVLGPALNAIREGVVTETTHDADTGRFLVNVVYAPEVPVDVSAIAGDIIQNLRAALDHAAYQAVWRTQGRPWEGSQFPLADAPSLFSRRDRDTLAKLGDFVAVVQRHQPNKDVNIYCREGIAADDNEAVSIFNANLWLGRLRDLSNRDKHRLLVPRYARADDASFIPKLIEGCAPTPGAEVMSGGDLIPGAEPIADFIANPNPGYRPLGTRIPKMQVDFRFRPRVGLSGFGDVEAVLDAMAAKVVRVIREFEPLF